MPIDNNENGAGENSADPTETPKKKRGPVADDSDGPTMQEMITTIEFPDQRGERLAGATEDEPEIAERDKPVVEACSRIKREHFEGNQKVVVDPLVSMLKRECSAFEIDHKVTVVRAIYSLLLSQKLSAVEFDIFKKTVAKDVLGVSKSSLEDSLRDTKDSAYMRIHKELIPNWKGVKSEEPIEVSVDDWRSELQYEQLKDKSKRVVRSMPNALRAIQLCPDTAGLLRKNLLSEKVEIHGVAPWWPESQEVLDYRELSDLDAYQAQVYFNEVWQLPAEDGGMRVNFSAEALDAAMRVEGSRCQYDPVQEYLDGLSWDGVPRMETALHSVFGCEDSEYGRLVSRVLFTSLAARQLDPGCKSDIAVILEGDEGIFKSTFVSKLVPDQRWYSDHLPPLGDKDAMQALRGRVVIEIAEMAAISMTKSWDAVKTFMSRRVDKFRPSHARYEVEQSRRCIFVVTTNEDRQYLKGTTGLRRFLPIQCQRKADMGWWLDHRNLILAEAVHHVRLFLSAKAAGNQVINTGHLGQWWPTDAEEAEARFERQDRIQGDDWAESVREFIHVDTGGRLRGEFVDRTYPKEMLTLVGLDQKEVNKRINGNRMKNLLESMGFVQGQYPLKKTSVVHSGGDQVSALWMTLSEEAWDGFKKAHDLRKGDDEGDDEDPGQSNVRNLSDHRRDETAS